ncbi:hypothetical protein [Pseudonocardia spinosispora]|uniref:hypothetical protein n=1 Tax=Pseudonocardia spinosispora TaxID=103441 RepID=UPI0003F8A74F|nr:hypothetical protein [Pseudonocardia spinosispora]
MRDRDHPLDRLSEYAVALAVADRQGLAGDAKVIEGGVAGHRSAQRVVEVGVG